MRGKPSPQTIARSRASLADAAEYWKRCLTSRARTEGTEAANLAGCTTGGVPGI
jgi:hypothetical protein